MSPVLIVGIVITVLFVLVCYGLLVRTLKNKRQHKQRLLRSLQQRADNFTYVINGIPDGFLTPDLTEFAYRYLIDVEEQIAKLDPKNPRHKQTLEGYRARLQQAQNHSRQPQRVHLETPQQMDEARQHLQELHRFVEKLQLQGAISQAQAKLYSEQIHKLELQTSVDVYMAQGKQAKQQHKYRQAIHYYTLARDLLVNTNIEKAYQKQIDKLDSAINALEKQLPDKGKATQPVSDEV